MSREWSENLFVYTRKRKRFNNSNIPNKIHHSEELDSDKVNDSKLEQPKGSSKLHKELKELGSGVVHRDVKGKRICKVNTCYSDYILDNNKLRKSSELMGTGLRFFGEGVTREKLEISAIWKNKESKLFGDCSSLLMCLMKHRYGWIFNNPVDVVKLRLDDYYRIIKHPMDLGTIKNNLNSNLYKSPLEFVKDLRLTFTNAMVYNPKGHAVHVIATEMMKIFQSKWENIEKEFGLEKINQMENVLLPPSCKLSVSGSSLEEIGSHQIKTSILKKPKANDPNKRNMSQEEKKKLCESLGRLPQYNLYCVLNIIKRRKQIMIETDEFIEVDIDIYDAETLWELDRYVTKYEKKINKQKRNIGISNEDGHCQSRCWIKNQ